MEEIYKQSMTGTSNFKQIKQIENNYDKNKKAYLEKILGDSIKEADNLQIKANRAIQELAAVNTESIHETMIAIEKATVSFQMMMKIRNKIIEAYHEIMKSSI